MIRFVCETVQKTHQEYIPFAKHAPLFRFPERAHERISISAVGTGIVWHVLLAVRAVDFLSGPAPSSHRRPARLLLRRQRHPGMRVHDSAPRFAAELVMRGAKSQRRQIHVKTSRLL